MDINKLFWSKVKTDILKYLIFVTEGISIRNLEAKLNNWSFPAIKKQIDILEKADILEIKKDVSNQWWEIYIKPWLKESLKRIFLYSIMEDLKNIFEAYKDLVLVVYFGQLFMYPVEVDLVIIYQDELKAKLDALKLEIDNLFQKYFINTIKVSFLPISNYRKLYRCWDRFITLLENKWYKYVINKTT